MVVWQLCSQRGDRGAASHSPALPGFMRLPHELLSYAEPVVTCAASGP